MVAVRDTGPGIPDEHRNKVFLPFYTTKPVGVGSGLGLSICHNIITSLGGQIDVESQAGKGGTEIVVRLPAAPPMSESDEAPSVAPAQSDRPKRRSSPPSRRWSVLVVDDEIRLLRSVKMMLEDDYDITTASSGGEAKSLIVRGSADFDVILCDLLMRDVSGMELYDWLHEHRPELCERIVFMTGGAFTPRAEAFLETVDNPSLSKPFEPSELEAVVVELLEGFSDGG